jgi:hypothetical protein
MDAWVLGYCLNSPNGSRPGKVLALMGLRRDDDGKFIGDQSLDLKKEFGESRIAFWPTNPPSLQNLTGCVVRFRCQPTPEYGDTTTPRNWQEVVQTRSGRDCQRFGYRIVELGVEADWRQEPRWVTGLTEGEEVFGRQDNSLVGRWRVGRELTARPDERELSPYPDASRVHNYLIKELKHDSTFYGEMRLSGRLKKLELLLYLPNESLGEPLDLFTQRDLANWLIEQINRHAPALIVRLDQESPGWRKGIRAEVEDYSSSKQRLSRGRWERLEAILDFLVFDAEQIDRLLKHAKFLQRFHSALAARVEDEVRRKSAEIETEAANSASGVRARLEEQITELETRRSGIETEVAKMDARKCEQDGREKLLREMTEHLVGSRNRLISDAAALQRHLGFQVNEHAQSNGQRADPEARPQPPPFVAQTTNGSPVTSPQGFVDARLWSALQDWLPGTPRTMAVMLHSAIAACRATLVPNPAWAKAYAEAFGGPARLTIVSVEPTWLGFADLWRGGFGECWQRAFQAPNLIELVLLRDFNRALPQCYARPLLDLLAGFAAELPAPGRGGWPPNLRLLACPAPLNEALPLTLEVVQHFAAIQKVPAASIDELPPDMKAGHLPADTWLCWPGHPTAPTPLGDWAKAYGPLARSAAIELAAVAGVLQQFGLSVREAVVFATDIRATGSAEYAEDPYTTAGTTQ